MRNQRNPFEGIATDLLAVKTVRAYNYDWGMWCDYCDIHGHRPLPVDVEDFTDWLESEVDDIGLSTLNRRIATAKSAHKFNNLNTLEFPLRVRVLRQTINSRKKPVKQAPAMRLTDVHNICETPIVSIRDRALISLMFDALLRGEDALHLRWSDVIVEADEYGTRAYIRIMKTKGKFNAVGELRALSRRTVLLLEEYHEEASHGYKRPTNESIFPIGSRTVRQIFEQLEEKTGKRFTSHSPRVGATVDMIESGVSEVDVCINAGWSSVEMVRRYARNANVKKGAMTKFMNKVHESKWLDQEPVFCQHHR